MKMPKKIVFEFKKKYAFITIDDKPPIMKVEKERLSLEYKIRTDCMCKSPKLKRCSTIMEEIQSGNICLKCGLRVHDITGIEYKEEN